jgi:hypothetical protein
MYETQSNRQSEAEFSAIISDAFKCNLHKLPIRYGLDFSVEKGGEVFGFIETKIRTNPVGQYPTYMISLGKFMSADAITRATGLKCKLAVKWSDAWGHVYLKMTPDISVSMGGRRDRGDQQDIEPVCLIPISSFEITFLKGSS